MKIGLHSIAFFKGMIMIFGYYIMYIIMIAHYVFLRLYLHLGSIILRY